MKEFSDPFLIIETGVELILMSALVIENDSATRR